MSEKKSISELLNNSKKKVQSLLTTSNGTKERLFKKSIFESMDENQIKSYRRKTRNYIHNLLISIIDNKDNEKALKTLCTEFVDFYKEVYILNDYSFNSIASENTKGENKQIILQGLEIIKNFNSKNKNK